MMKKAILSLVFLSLFLSCGSEKTALEMKKGEIREDTGLFLIIGGKICRFFGVNKSKSKIARDYSHSSLRAGNDRVIFSLYRISEPVSNLRRIRFSDHINNEEKRYVWVKLTFHAKEDMKGIYSKEKGKSDLYWYKGVSYFFGDMKIDSIQILDKVKEKIYLQTMDSLTKAHAPDILYGP